MLFRNFLSHRFLSYYLFWNSYGQSNMTSKSISHTIYFESSYYLMYHTVLELCNGGHFLKDCFYCYSQQIKSAVANEYLIPYNHMKKTPYFCYLLTWNLVHILSHLNMFKKAMKPILMWRDYKSTFYWTFIMKYFVLFLPISNKSAIQNNPLMQSLYFAVFQQLGKLWKEGGVMYILFLSLFLTVHEFLI